MKKKTKIIVAILIIVICLFVAVIAFLSVGRAGGEISFEATINRVEDGIAYATVTDDSAWFGAKKLPEQIEFKLDDLGELKAGDEIHGNYLRGTIDGQTVRVVSVSIKNVDKLIYGATHDPNADNSEHAIDGPGMPLEPTE